MPMEKDIFRVMVVSGGTKMAQLLKETLPAGQFMIMTNVTTMGEAKRRMMGTAYDIVIINTRCLMNSAQCQQSTCRTVPLRHTFICKK